MPVFPFCELSQAQRNRLNSTNALRIDVRQCSSTAFVPWEESFTTCVWRSHLHNAEGNEEIEEVAQLRSEICLTL